MGVVYQHFDSDIFQFRSTTFPQYVKTDGTYNPITALAYDATTEEMAYVRFRAVNYGSGNITCNIGWYPDTAVSGDIIWGVSLSAMTPNTDVTDVETKNFATEQTVTDTVLGTVGQRPHECTVVISNLDSIASSDWAWLRVSRKAAAGGDTMTGDGWLVMVDISYSDT